MRGKTFNIVIKPILFCIFDRNFSDFYWTPLEPNNPKCLKTELKMMPIPSWEGREGWVDEGLSRCRIACNLILMDQLGYTDTQCKD